jgi:GTPase SAR1 family protein
MLPSRRIARAACRAPSLRPSLSLSTRFLATSTEDASDNSKSSNSIADQIINDCFKFRSSVQELNDKCNGPLEKNGLKNTILPFVFLLGNHSSGKSSFINYVCGRYTHPFYIFTCSYLHIIIIRKVQTAGVAPTDDTFTIIVPGPADSDRDGLAFIGDPDMGFAGLRTFGPQLIHHTQLKVRDNIAVKNFMLVDTPGMIDSPMVTDPSGNTSKAVMDRGYDFAKVCKWYADRADVILLFFDPDKPGTTGETLSVLTSSLVGLDHKLYIILNKADQFKKIHDFARAYGSLCWNLSKVIHRKDLPRIYTMCLPTAYQARASGDQSVDEGSNLGHGLVDLQAVREEVLAEVMNSPKRRIDNEISRLSESIAVLQMHCQLINEIRKRYRSQLWNHRLTLLGGAALSLGIPASSFYLGLPVELYGTFTMASVLGLATIGYLQMQGLESLSKRLISDESLQSIFKNLYARRIYEKDEYTSSLWVRVREHLKLELTPSTVQGLDAVSTSELNRLESILESEIPKLRRISAPLIFK